VRGTAKLFGEHDGEMKDQFFGDELLFPVRSRKDPTVIAFRSVWRRIDTDTFEVRRESPDGAGWKTELTVVYHKDGAAP
jgi:hypothetical protein